MQEELDAAKALFKRAGAENIELNLTMPEDFSEAEGDSCIVEGVAYEIRVRIDDTTYLAQATANFFLEKTDGEWLTEDWYDIVDYRLLAESTSWGQIETLD